MSDNKIDLDAKTDRELLIMAVQELNALSKCVEKIRKWKDGNGIPGAQFQLWVLWAVFVFIVAKMW